MKKFMALLVLIASLSSASLYANTNKTLKSYGIEKQTTDTHNTRADTYTKEVGKGYGIYGRSTREFKNAHGERETSANEVKGRDSKSIGVYKTF